MKTLAFFLSDLINIGQCNSIKYCELRDTDPRGVVTFSFQKKNHTSASKTILGLLVAFVSFSSKPFPKENHSLNSQRILSKKDLTELHMLTS